MATDPSARGAYGYSSDPASGGWSYVGKGTTVLRPPQRPNARPLPDADAGSYTYTAPARAFRPVAGRTAPSGTGQGRRIGAIGALVAGLVVAAILLPSLAFGMKDTPSGSYLSRYNPLVAGVKVLGVATGQQAAAQNVADALTGKGATKPGLAHPVAADPSRPARAAHTPDYQLAAPPSISAATVDRVLAQYNSPAAGSGALFYDLGVQYGIDPAYALAFYIHESSAGTKGVARFTHGIGNIRVTSGYQSYEGYRSYPTYAAGIEDWYKLIKELYIQGWGLTTPGPILARYAPWGDNNNPDVYAATVKALVASWATPQ